jgi:hypothetical protein
LRCSIVATAGDRGQRHDKTYRPIDERAAIVAG